MFIVNSTNLIILKKKQKYKIKEQYPQTIMRWENVIIHFNIFMTNFFDHFNDFPLVLLCCHVNVTFFRSGTSCHSP